MPGRTLSARYDLGEVRALAAATGRTFIGSKVIARTFEDYPAAKPRVFQFILSIVGALTESCFVETKTLAYSSGPVDADVYGVENAEGSWYVKLYIVKSQLIVVSCHSPDYDLRLANGLIVRRG